MDEGEGSFEPEGPSFMSGSRDGLGMAEGKGAALLLSAAWVCGQVRRTLRLVI